jgi:hypothetical protein
VNGPIHIHTSYSVVQVAGAHSSQSAQLTLNHSKVIQILNEIERELPKLKLAPGEREEANGLVASLRKALRDLPGAGARAIGGALAAILTSAGSELGKRLLDSMGLGLG